MFFESMDLHRTRNMNYNSMDSSNSGINTVYGVYQIQ